MGKGRGKGPQAWWNISACRPCAVPADLGRAQVSLELYQVGGPGSGHGEPPASQAGGLSPAVMS